MFSRMRAHSQRYAKGVWPGREPSGEVVEVEATVVNDRDGSESPLQRLR
jgi:hypothetical protein